MRLLTFLFWGVTLSPTIIEAPNVYDPEGGAGRDNKRPKADTVTASTAVSQIGSALGLEIPL